jgi:hypothetical protein
MENIAEAASCVVNTSMEKHSKEEVFAFLIKDPAYLIYYTFLIKII